MALSSTKRCVSGVDTHTHTFQTMLIARSVFLSNGSVGLLMHQTTGMVGLVGAGDSGDEDKENEREEDEGDEGECTGDDLSATVVLTRSVQSDAQDGPDNPAENSSRVNAHQSVSHTPQLVQHHSRAATHNRDRTKKKNPTTIVFKNLMTNPSELEGIMRSAHQQPSRRAAVIEGESWDGTTEENIAKYLRVLPPSESPDAL